MNASEYIESFVRTYMPKNRRERTLFEYAKKPGDALRHFCGNAKLYLIAEKTHPVRFTSAELLREEMLARGATEIVCVVNVFDASDAREMPLRDALEPVIHWMSALVIPQNASVVFLRAEEHYEQYLLY